MRRVSACVATTAGLALGVLAASASPAAAGPPDPAPSGWCGAANMRNAGQAMADAMMYHTNEHGDAGMFRAVARSACRP